MLFSYYFYFLFPWPPVPLLVPFFGNLIWRSISYTVLVWLGQVQILPTALKMWGVKHLYQTLQNFSTLTHFALNGYLLVKNCPTQHRSLRSLASENCENQSYLQSFPDVLWVIAPTTLCRLSHPSARRQASCLGHVAPAGTAHSRFPQCHLWELSSHS